MKFGASGSVLPPTATLWSMRHGSTNSGGLVSQVPDSESLFGGWWDDFCVATPFSLDYRRRPVGRLRILVFSHKHSMSVTRARPDHPLPTNVIYTSASCPGRCSVMTTMTTFRRQRAQSLNMTMTMMARGVIPPTRRMTPWRCLQTIPPRVHHLQAHQFYLLT